MNNNMIRNQIKWRTISFLKIAHRVKYNIKKYKNEEYQKSGKYPIIDQGKELIIGYTDDEKNIYKSPLPVIIFGDHTRISKYINFPFAIGADGVIILRINQGFDPKFFYYLMCNTNIKNLGYSRHYSILKKTIFQIPPLPEQERIVNILNDQMALVEKARNAAKERLEAVKALPSAHLRKVFPQPGQPLPKGWRWVKLDEICNKKTGTRDPSLKPDTPFKYVDISSINNTQKYITEARTILGKDAPSRARQIIKKYDILVATTRPNLNSVALVPLKLDNQICSTGFCVLRAGEELLSEYLFAFVRCQYFIEALSDMVKGALYPAVNDGQVKSQEIPLPPTEDEQRRIAKILNEQMALVEKARSAAEAELETINALPGAILRKAFSGEL